MAQRELSATKLEESVRQLKRYIQTGATSKRIIQKRCERVESDKDEFIEIHHCYAEKSGKTINDEVMRLLDAEVRCC